VDNISSPVEAVNPDLFEPKAILLTGITGFLGIYLLASLLAKTNATIYCLIRGNAVADASRKLEQNLKRHKFDRLINTARIKIILGDLDKPRLGLSQAKFMQLAKKIDSIYHSGAAVNNIFDYKKLRGTNVFSTLELLKLACHYKNKIFHYISTVSCVSKFDKKAHALEDGPTDNFPKFVNGYSLTKWASERILWRAKKRGFLVNIYRPGNITGDTKYGSCHPEANYLLLLLKGCIQAKTYPQWQVKYDLVPVDILANAIIGISLQKQIIGKAFNLQHPSPPSWQEYMQWVREFGYKIKAIDNKTWHESLFSLNQDSAMFPLLSYYLKDGYTELYETERIYCQKTQRILHKFGIEYIKIDKKYIFQCLKYLVDTHFLPKPHPKEKI
jgi:thioester reductase-like protein